MAEAPAPSKSVRARRLALAALSPDMAARGAMASETAALDWRADLRDRPVAGEERGPHDHESLRDRAITFVERSLFGGRHVWASRNYTMLPGVKLPRKRNAPTPR